MKYVLYQQIVKHQLATLPVSQVNVWAVTHCLAPLEKQLLKASHTDVDGFKL